MTEFTFTGVMSTAEPELSDEETRIPGTKYEYTIVRVTLPANDDEVIALLNEKGAAGWQLNFMTNINAGRLWLMREVK